VPSEADVQLSELYNDGEDSKSGEAFGVMVSA